MVVFLLDVSQQRAQVTNQAQVIPVPALSSAPRAAVSGALSRPREDTGCEALEGIVKSVRDEALIAAYKCLKGGCAEVVWPLLAGDSGRRSPGCEPCREAQVGRSDPFPLALRC